MPQALYVLDISVCSRQLFQLVFLSSTQQCSTISRLDVLRRLGNGRQPSGREYETLRRGHSNTANWSPDDARDDAPVRWYWHLLALAASLMILGGLLILPSSFDNDPDRKVNQTGLAVFGLCLVTAGFSFSALIAFSVRQPRFKADVLFLPCLIYSAVGLLTVFYDFIISARYSWNTAALLTTVGAAIATIAYAVLWAMAQRKARRRTAAANAHLLTLPLAEPVEQQSRPHMRTDSSTGERWQDPSYYENFTRNAYPTAYSQPWSSRHSHQSGTQQENITEEEMQRQQMLMLLMQNPPITASGAHADTFHIEWPGHDQDVLSPNNHRARTPLATSANRSLQPWDGIWRGPPRITLPRIEQSRE